MTGSTRIDVESALSGLKDFQRSTVEYVFRRMYLDNDYTRRFLIADEVGLGKTLVARGVIARTIEHLSRAGVDRIDIVYICSNADIARQNIRRLNISEEAECSLAERITLLPKKLHDLEGRGLNFVSFTPGTSFDLKEGLGRQDERALLCCILEDIWDLHGTGKWNVLQGNVTSRPGFRRLIEDTRAEGYDEGLVREFEVKLGKHDQVLASADQPRIRARFERLCRSFRCRTSPATDDEWRERRSVIGELRALLARACMDALEPDLIIMDEFQRFKHLLTGEDDASQLAQALFNYSDSQTKARVLLLSATPYRMYTIADDGDQDEHYEDFLATLRFLQADEAATDEFRRLLGEYRRQIYMLGNGDTGGLQDIKSEMETRLRKVMVRTERLAVTTDRGGMLQEHRHDGLQLEPADIRQYMALSRIAGHLQTRSPLEYWKSAPYLLNFMEDYSMKQDFAKAADDDNDGELARLVREELPLLLSAVDVRKYRVLDPANVKLRKVINDLVGLGAWRLLWIPPALPYYQLAGAYDAPGLAGLTKRLVFSSWKVVPKAVAALVSYDAERRMMKAFDNGAENSADARKRHQRLLRFATSEGRLTGMPVLGLVYPSVVLARECDPLEFYRSNCGSGSLPTRDEAVAAAQQRVCELLRPLRQLAAGGTVPDESWYWAAPALIDLVHDGQPTKRWLARNDLAAAWCGEEQPGDDEGGATGDTAWDKHVQTLQSIGVEFAKKQLRLGPIPDDLERVLAEVSLGGPGVVVLRTLRRLVGSESDDVVRTAAARSAYGLLAMFNRPESASMIRSMNGEEPFWRRVVEYCVDGGLQSVMDEYGHVLLEYAGVAGKSAEDVVDTIAGAITETAGLIAASVYVDGIRLTKGGSVAVDKGAMQMRCRFAARFGDSPGAEGGDGVRGDRVRAAFNSPFWPFAVASTSVGQEGLDFHCYCHAIVHWNLPSNPVDLEQREGRIHRYKGHAVRKNVAKRFANELAGTGPCDPWRVLFDAAVACRAAGVSDLEPFWVFKVDGGALIERHVPVLPLSRDAERYSALLRSLACYRMVFGQTRQDDMMAFLLRFASGFAEQEARSLMMDLSPR